MRRAASVAPAQRFPLPVLPVAREAGGGSGGRAPHIGIVGAGILGTVLALRLAEGGARVTLLERAPTPGGSPGRLISVGIASIASTT